MAGSSEAAAGAGTSDAGGAGGADAAKVDGGHDRKDLAVGLVGALVLTGLIAGLFVLRDVSPDPGAGFGGTGLYDLTYEEEAHACAASDHCTVEGPASGDLGEGEEATLTVNLTALNVTAVTVTLEWDQPMDDLDRDRFRLALAAGAGVETDCDEEKSGTTGTLSVTCAGVEVPDDRAQVPAASRADALRGAGDDGATGHYAVTVTLDDTSPTAAADPLDDGNEYTVTVRYRDYHGQVERSENQVEE